MKLVIGEAWIRIQKQGGCWWKLWGAEHGNDQPQFNGFS